MLKTVLFRVTTATLVLLGLMGVPAASAQAAVTAQASVAVATPPPFLPSDTVDTLSTRPPAVNKKLDKAPKGVKAPKARPGQVSSGGVTTMATCSSPCFEYAGAANTDQLDGASVNMQVIDPVRDPLYDYHSLAELAVSKTINGKQQTIEVGITDDAVVNGGCTPQPSCKDRPFLFVFHWIDDVPQCYNGCGWVDNGAVALNAGADLSSMVGTNRRARIEYFSGNWWIAFDNQWIGHFPGTRWTNAGVVGFTNTTLQQSFGEIVSSDDLTCGDMGTGVMAAGAPTPAGASLGSFNKVLGGVASLETYNYNYATKPAKWGFAALSGSTFRYGGPGC